MSVHFEDHSEECLDALEAAALRIITIWGQKITGWAAKLCPVGTVESTGKKGYRGGTLRNSITFEVDRSSQTVSVGTNVEYGPYVELGTGPYFEAPPDWEAFDVPQPLGIGRGYMRARPFIRPAVENHKKNLENIMKNELENA